MHDVMNALFGPMGTAVFLHWAEVGFILVAMACGALVFMAVHERAGFWSDAAHRLWLEAATEDGGPDRGPSTLDGRALALTVAQEEATGPEDAFLVAAVLSKSFEEESRRILKDAHDRLRRFKRAPENRARLRAKRGEPMLYFVSQTVLTIAGCILVTSLVWSDFAWQGASALSVARGGSDLGWEDHVALDKIMSEERRGLTTSIQMQPIYRRADRHSDPTPVNITATRQ
jgi:hypothetical protein